MKSLLTEVTFAAIFSETCVVISVPGTSPPLDPMVSTAKVLRRAALLHFFWRPTSLEMSAIAQNEAGAKSIDAQPPREPAGSVGRVLPFVEGNFW